MKDTMFCFLQFIVICEWGHEDKVYQLAAIFDFGEVYAQESILTSHTMFLYDLMMIKVICAWPGIP